jgi:hypothetical protein
MFLCQNNYFGFNHIDYTNCFDFVVQANFVPCIVDYQINSVVVVRHSLLEILGFATVACN